jgi:hypothetical protein
MGRRTGTRYLNILRGKRGQPAKTRLLSYLNGDIELNYPERAGNRPEREVVWVVPFGIPVTAGSKLSQYVNSQRFAGVSAFVAGFIDNAPPAAPANKIILRGVLAPRAAITTGRSTTGTSATSKVSGLPYKKYGGNSVTVPFGAGDAATEKNEDSVFRLILARVKEADGDNICSFVPGSYSV